MHYNITIQHTIFHSQWGKIVFFFVCIIRLKEKSILDNLITAHKHSQPVKWFERRKTRIVDNLVTDGQNNNNNNNNNKNKKVIIVCWSVDAAEQKHLTSGNQNKRINKRKNFFFDVGTTIQLSNDTKTLLFL